MCVNKYFKAIAESSSFEDYVNSNNSFGILILNTNIMTWHPIVLSIEIKETLDCTIYRD